MDVFRLFLQFVLEVWWKMSVLTGVQAPVLIYTMEQSVSQPIVLLDVIKVDTFRLYHYTLLCEREFLPL